MKLRFALLATLVPLLLLPSMALSHCQVPCGIYDDAARIQGMLEDATTIEKAMASITELVGKADAQSANQLTRWVMTKEDHASAVISVLSEYFLTQKVKVVAEGEEGYESYLRKLADHHAVLRAAMKCKQTVDAENVTALRAAIINMSQYYDLESLQH